MSNTQHPQHRDITTLQSILMDTLQDLRDPNKKIDKDRLDAVVAVSGRLIETAKVEVDYAKHVGSIAGFVPNRKALPKGGE